MPVKNKQQQQQRRSLPFNSDELLALCAKANFTIGRSSSRGVIVTNPENNAGTLITNTVRAGTKGRNLHAQLVRIGLLDALAKAEEEREEGRQATLADDRGRAEAATRAAEESARAANNVVKHVIKFTPPGVTSENGGANGSHSTPAAMPKKAEVAARVAAGTPTRPSTGNGGDGPPEMYVKKVLVTPEMALEWLTREESTLPNGTKIKQRTRRPAHVKELARLMDLGDWLLTPQGLALAPEAPYNTGAVLDGQHRLEAVIEHGKPVEFWVSFNVDPATFKVLDTGKTRSTADVLTTLGQKSTTHLASVLKLFIVWEMWNADPKAFADWRNWARIKVSNIETAEAFERAPYIAAAMNDTRCLVGQPPKYNLPAATIFRLWLGQQWPKGTVVAPGEKLCPIDAWLQKLFLGIGLGVRPDGKGGIEQWKEDPMLVVRNWAENSAKITRLYPGQVREVHLLALCRAWNYHLEGRGMGYVHIKATDLMPVPRPPSE
jgi:hypothetical protein